MNLRTITSAAVAVALSASPALAGPAASGPAASGAGASNPAASLSLSKGVRAGGKTGKGSKISGGVGILAALLLAGIIAIPVIDAVKDDTSDSN